MSEIQPPSSGPATGATSVVMDQTASAMPALCLGKLASISACDSGIIGPATAPCSTRKPIRASSVGEKPHSHEASTNSRVEVRNSRTWPKRCVSQPVSGTVMALATANEVMTQVPWLVLTPRSPEMVGIDTLAIEVSSTFMNTAVDSAIEPMMRVAPSSGG
ncbi:Uncharacterised protein [Bordetella pertussis]|nr:Uncharacterised protein [Bordetella pertussis]CFE03128.1 Uncharacterised protein [Bordetella pertussis]CFO02850.1 Uncharacterised protein [Bordetella pertussis]CFP08978.1 Uncharacterised protein [Bordetella pertussis]CFP11614.1 Uncharacterised protein [Bordetella pertussis]